MYILATISCNYKTTEIEFPINDDRLEQILQEAEMPTDTTVQLFATENIQHPQQLSILRGSVVNLD